MSDIYQTYGEREFMTFTVTGDATDDFTTYPVVVGFGTRTAPPTTWVTPSGVDDLVTIAGNVVTVRLKVGTGTDAHPVTSGTDWGWMKVGDDTTTLVRIVRCGKFKLI